MQCIAVTDPRIPADPSGRLQGNQPGHERPQHERAHEEGHCLSRGSYNTYEKSQSLQLKWISKYFAIPS